MLEAHFTTGGFIYVQFHILVQYGQSDCSKFSRAAKKCVTVHLPGTVRAISSIVLEW